MSKDTPPGQRPRHPKTVRQSGAPSEKISWGRAAGEFTISFIHKGVHDAAAHIVTTILLGALTLVLGYAGLYYLAQRYHLERLLPEPRSQIETGSILKPPAPAKPVSEQDKRAEIECWVQKTKEVAAAVEQRQSAWAEYTTCRDQWVLFATKTPEQRCAAKFDIYARYRQAALDREAKDCTMTATK